MKNMLEVTDKQEIFDFVVGKLADQGAKSTMIALTESLCAYRGANGRKCAVGHCIPDDVYYTSMEMKTIYDLLDDRDRAEFDTWRLAEYQFRTFIRDMQKTHDMARTLPRLPGSCADVTFADVWAIRSRNGHGVGVAYSFDALAEKYKLDPKIVHDRWGPKP